MKDFKEHVEDINKPDPNIVQTIRDLIIIEETDSATLNEMFEFGGERLDEGISDLLKKAGLTAHRGKGLIDYLKSAGVGVSKIVIAAIKGDTEEMKRIMKTVTKEDVIDFLLKLDMATLHLITGPIHTIDAITGWHLWANLKKTSEKASNIVKKVKDAIHFVKTEIGKIFDKSRAQKHQSYLDAMEHELG